MLIILDPKHNNGCNWKMLLRELATDSILWETVRVGLGPGLPNGNHTCMTSNFSISIFKILHMHDMYVYRMQDSQNIIMIKLDAFHVAQYLLVSL